MAAQYGDVVFNRDADVEEHNKIWDDTALIEAYDRAVNLAKVEVARRIGVSLSGNDSASSQSKDSKKKKKKKRKKSNKNWHVSAPCRAPYNRDGQMYEATIQSINAGKGTCLVRYVGYNNEEEIPMKLLLHSCGKKVRMRQEAQARWEEMEEEDVSESEESQEDYESSAQGSAMDLAESNAAQSPQHGEKTKPKSSSKSGCQTNMNRDATPTPQCPPWMRPGTGMFMPPAAAHLSNGYVPVNLPFMPPYQPFCNTGQSAPFPPPPWKNVGSASHSFSSIPPPPPLLSDDVLAGDTEALSAMLMAWYMSGYHTGFYHGLKHSRSKASQEIPSKSGMSCSGKKSGR